MQIKKFRANYETFNQLMRDTASDQTDIQFIGFKKHHVDDRVRDIVHTIDDKFIGMNADSDWTIHAHEECDYYTWYEYFWAEHPILGTVFGHIDDGVFVKGGTKALKHFLKHHPYTEFCYGDI